MVEINLTTSSKRPENYRPEEISFLESGSIPGRSTIRTSLWRPPTDVYETDEALVVRVEVAGMREDGFAIELNGRVLVIRGVRQDLSERRAFHQMEIRFGEFSSEIEVPVPVIADQAEAFYVQGFLRIVLPKAQAWQVPVKESPAT